MNIPPIKLIDASIEFMSFDSSVRKTVMERPDRYELVNSAIKLERPPALVSNTVNLPPNAIQGDEIYNWETKRKMIYNGTEWINLY
ncbi:hypothetical protein [Providencia sneebia]|uniref:hypothetical protein n=1 Tax=Providencia sneebia TaxID=516075 RepID=UPI0012EA1513